jgi:hypothetical protein
LWIGSNVRDITVLPKCWFDILGDHVDVYATLKKRFPAPKLSAEDWSRDPFDLQTFSVTFPGILLPEIPRLLALFTPDIVISEMTAQNVLD